jgi:ATP-binding cassette subfamily B protein
LTQCQHGGALAINETKNIVVTFLAAQQVIDGHITLGTLLAVQYIIGQLSAPLNQLITFLHTAQNARLSLERIAEIHAVKDEDEPGRGLSVLPESPDLHLTDVSFRYGGPQNRPVFAGLSLTAPAGAVTAIVGPSGSGKSTLLKLLLKFHDPLEGEIRLGHIGLRHFSHRFWREQCGVVMQDGHVFSDTIANNIALGGDHVDRVRLMRAARVANVEEFVDRLPLGYETKIGREGIGLSKGQTQRILIARAVYKNPRFLFFDEATSALDSETEKAIVTNLRSFFEGRTVVVIAHRLSTVKHADNIIVLGEGCVAEQGTHYELTQRRGTYHRLIKNQLELGQ